MFEARNGKTSSWSSHSWLVASSKSKGVRLGRLGPPGVGPAMAVGGRWLKQEERVSRGGSHRFGSGVPSLFVVIDRERKR